MLAFLVSRSAKTPALPKGGRAGYLRRMMFEFTLISPGDVAYSFESTGGRLGEGLGSEIKAVHLSAWEGVRKIKTGWETADLFAFLTADPSEPVKSVHPAMPVILTQADETEAWMTALWSEASTRQRVLPDGGLEPLA